jgi:hypothetical protein
MKKPSIRSDDPMSAILQIRDYQRPEERQAATRRLEQQLNREAIEIFGLAFPSVIGFPDYSQQFWDRLHDTSPSEMNPKEPA